MFLKIYFNEKSGEYKVQSHDELDYDYVESVDEFGIRVCENLYFETGSGINPKDALNNFIEKNNVNGEDFIREI